MFFLPSHCFLLSTFNPTVKEAHNVALCLFLIILHVLKVRKGLEYTFSTSVVNKCNNIPVLYILSRAKRIHYFMKGSPSRTCVTWPITLPMTLITHSLNSHMISPQICSDSHTHTRSQTFGIKRHRDRNRPNERKDESKFHVLNRLAVTERGWGWAICARVWLSVYVQCSHVRLHSHHSLFLSLSAPNGAARGTALYYLSGPVNSTAIIHCV